MSSFFFRSLISNFDKALRTAKKTDGFTLGVRCDFLMWVPPATRALWGPQPCLCHRAHRAAPLPPHTARHASTAPYGHPGCPARCRTPIGTRLRPHRRSNPTPPTPSSGHNSSLCDDLNHFSPPIVVYDSRRNHRLISSSYTKVMTFF